MSIATLEDYASFHCIADKCKHTCCKGWEIDIDAKTLQYYQTLEGPLQQRLQRHIALGDTPHFILDQQERCPFLNEQNLCDLILELGEQSLCQICTDHPRFRNTIGSRTEIGLGLCCEEAARQLLSKQTPSKVKVSGQTAEQLTPAQEKLLAERNRAFAILQNRTLSIEARMQKLLAAFQAKTFSFSNAQRSAFLSALERMENAWTAELQLLQNSTAAIDSLPTEFWIPLEQLLFYFVYRYFTQAYDEAECKAYLAFSVFSVETIANILQAKSKMQKVSLQELIQITRLYSSEIEYSEENMDAILNALYAIQ